jgi:hypothetical protein
MPVDPAEPVVTAACVFCCRRAMGEALTRHSLRPLLIEGHERRITWAFRAAGMPALVIASEAKQSIALRAEPWIASSLTLLAMTT